MSAAAKNPHPPEHDDDAPTSPVAWLHQSATTAREPLAEPLLSNAPLHGQDATVYASVPWVPAILRGGGPGDDKAVGTGGWGYLPGPSESVNVVMAWVYRVRTQAKALLMYIVSTESHTQLLLCWVPASLASLACPLTNRTNVMQ